MSLLYLTILLISTAATTAAGDTTTTGDTVTNIEFYFHDILSGSNPTAKSVIQPISTSATSNFFGMVNVADDPLTEKADPKSKLIGRAQGLYAAVGQNDVALLMALSYGFVDGPYKGSSLSIMGKNPAMDPTRELPVLGGTGLFRLARGYAELKTISLNSAGDAVVHYNVTVYTPSSVSGSISPISSPGGGGDGATRASNTVNPPSSSSLTIRGKLSLFSSVIGFICLFYVM
ncbi:Dirigent protein 23 [Linum perenne]